MVDRIKIFYTDDESLKLLGELLGNETSRSIIKIISVKPHYTQEIANKLELSVSRIIHHLKKLEELGLVDITEKPLVKNGVKRRFFKINNDIFISKMTKEKTEKRGLLQRIFRDGVKFAIIGVSALFSQILMVENKIRNPDNFFSDVVVTSNTNFTVPLLIIIIGLSILLFFEKRKK